MVLFGIWIASARALIVSVSVFCFDDSHITLSVLCFVAQNRSPEEYFDHPLDEKIDIYSLGNIFVRFVILCG